MSHHSGRQAAKHGDDDDDNAHDRWLNLTELADYSGLSTRTLRRCLTDPKRPLPHHRVELAGTSNGRGRLLVSRRVFDQWMEQFAVARPVRSDDPTDTSWIRHGFKP